MNKKQEELDDHKASQIQETHSCQKGYTRAMIECSGCGSFNHDDCIFDKKSTNDLIVKICSNCLSKNTEINNNNNNNNNVSKETDKSLDS